MALKHIISSVASLVPIVKRFRAKPAVKGGKTYSARYCYSVWLRHLIMAKRNGLNTCPKVVVELGPGSSIGIGLAALICGCDKYFALDFIKFANMESNIKIFDELVTLFKNKSPIPGDNEFPRVKPYLEEYNFPCDILNETRLRHMLEKSRIQRIRDSISDSQSKDSLIQYEAPWYGENILKRESVDMIYSQAVLEHVKDLKRTYRVMHSWLKATGYMSHQIDFKCHGTADEWNGHWTYSDFKWKLITGKRPYSINRMPHSTHIKTLVEEGFEVTCDKTIKSDSHYAINDLAPKFRFLSGHDLITSGAFIQAVKKTKSNE